MSDVNDEFDDDDVDGNRVEGATAVGVLEYVVKELVRDPASVAVDTVQGRRGLTYEVSVGPGDMGRVIGRRGRIASVIRTVVRAAASKDGVEVDVDFVD